MMRQRPTAKPLPARERRRVPVRGSSRVIAGTADQPESYTSSSSHLSSRKTRCEGQKMPICESSIPKAIARSHFCQRFPSSEFSKGSQSSGNPHISALFVHDGFQERKKATRLALTDALRKRSCSMTNKAQRHPSETRNSSRG